MSLLGGSRVRVRFSNEFGDDPLTLRAANIAQSLGGGAIDLETGDALAFDGIASVEIAAGDFVLSDPVDFALLPLSDIAVTFTSAMFRKRSLDILAPARLPG